MSGFQHAGRALACRTCNHTAWPARAGDPCCCLVACGGPGCTGTRRLAGSIPSVPTGPAPAGAGRPPMPRTAAFVDPAGSL